MKNLITGLLCLAILAGCKKNDQQLTNASLTGKWTLKKVTSKFYQDGVYYVTKDSIYSTNNNYVQFNSDGTGTTNITESYFDINQMNRSVTGTFTYKISATSLLLTYSAVYEPFAKTVAFSNGQLIVHQEKSYNIILTFGGPAIITEKKTNTFQGNIQ